MRKLVVSLGLILAVQVTVAAMHTVAEAQDTGNQQSSADQATLDEALEAIRDGNFEKGTIILQRLGGQGNADSLFHLGELFRLGVGQEKSETVAIMYYRLSAALGHRRAALTLANFLFFEGDGTEATYGEALSLWQEAALDGDLEATYILGMIYWNGEAGVPQDPVRGYGLVWRAAQEGWADAEQNELTMRSLLPADAREAAMEYGRSLEVEGFSADQLALDLVMTEEPALESEEDDNEVEETAREAAVDEAPLEKPSDWAEVWRLEVGFAMSELEINRLRIIIGSTMPETVGELYDDIVPSVTRPGLYRLIYGPMRSMHHAVNTCVSLKRAGHDCNAQPPED